MAFNNISSFKLLVLKNDIRDRFRIVEVFPRWQKESVHVFALKDYRRSHSVQFMLGYVKCTGIFLRHKVKLHLDVIN